MYALSEIYKMKPMSLPIEVKQKIQVLCKQVGAEIPFTIIPQKVSIQDTIREVNKITEENKKEKQKRAKSYIHTVHACIRSIHKHTIPLLQTKHPRLWSDLCPA